VDGPEINQRAFRFACRCVELFGLLRRAGGAAWQIAPQLLRAGTSIGANLEEATGGQTKPDFVTKTCVALKEAREARFWLRVVVVCRLLPPATVEPDLQESNELVAILTTIIRNARSSPDRSKASG
jgi:four helix bundle protein